MMPNPNQNKSGSENAGPHGNPPQIMHHQAAAAEINNAVTAIEAAASQMRKSAFDMERISFSFKPPRPVAKGSAIASQSQIEAAARRHPVQMRRQTVQKQPAPKIHPGRPSYDETNMDVYAEKGPGRSTTASAAQTSAPATIPADAQNMRPQMDRMSNYFPS